MLFLGAGASKGFGLVNWHELVNLLRREVRLADIPPPNNADDLQHAADEVIDRLKSKDELGNLIQKCLYANIPNLTTDIFEQHLLVSISALLMGSKRGHVSRVITLNYDSMLEWFLSLFGFVVKTIDNLPALEGSEDVKIYHPHGYVPHPEYSLDRSNEIILGMMSANKRIGTPGEPWFEMIRHLLNTGLCLFIGMSSNTLSDRALAPLFSTAGETHRGTRPLGIWLLLESLGSSQELIYQRNNIVPLQFSTSKEISEFILKIAQDSMKKTKS